MISEQYSSFPDVEALVSKALRDVLTPIGVYSSMPADPQWPLITVKRLGGRSIERHRIDRARIQIDVWANSKSETYDLADEARVLTHEMEGRYFDEPVPGFIIAVDVEQGLMWLPDTTVTPPRDRYLFVQAISAHS